MIRLVLAGLWVCILTAGTSYGVAYWKENGSLLPAKDEYLDGLQYLIELRPQLAAGQLRSREIRLRRAISNRKLHLYSDPQRRKVLMQQGRERLSIPPQ